MVAASMTPVAKQCLAPNFRKPRCHTRIFEFFNSVTFCDSQRPRNLIQLECGFYNYQLLLCHLPHIHVT